MPDDVRGDIETLLAEYAAGQRGHGYTHRLSNRRNRHRFNSYGFAVDELKKLLPRNLAYLNPDEMAERGLVNGDWIEIASDNGTIEAIVEADETSRPGVEIGRGACRKRVGTEGEISGGG